jgi:imidazoleglycerol-phosphate dehydratase
VPPRKASCSRKTAETEISAEICFDSASKIEVGTGVPFFDHLLGAMAFHGRFGLALKARGDLQVDEHHLVEDSGIVLGEALARLVEEKGPVARFGHAVVPMDEALCEASIDVCGRPLLVFTGEFPQARIGAFEAVLVREFLSGLVSRARIVVHACLRYGANSHHLAESLFKALGLALAQAYRPLAGATLGEGQGMSTKGTIA